MSEINAIDRYFGRINEILAEVFSTQREQMEKAAVAIADADRRHSSVFTFGCNHAGLVTLELFYRSGGLVTVNPIRVPGMMLDVTPITMSSELERIPNYGDIMLKNSHAKEGDVLLIHSVSGRNAVTVDMANAARALGITVIALTNMKTSSAVASRHPSGKRLFECADIVIDNCGDLGDATLEVDSTRERIAPSSTAVGAAIVNAVIARAVELMPDPPVFMSGNIDGGDEHNRRVIGEHRENIFYM